jgi:hypothetical protein
MRPGNATHAKPLRSRTAIGEKNQQAITGQISGTLNRSPVGFMPLGNVTEEPVHTQTDTHSHPLNTKSDDVVSRDVWKGRSRPATTTGFKAPATPVGGLRQLLGLPE